MSCRTPPPGSSPSSRCASSSKTTVSNLDSIRELQSRVGEEVAVSPWLEIDQQRIDSFAKAIEEFQWIHVYPTRAKSLAFGGIIAHSVLTLSLMPHLWEARFSFCDRKMGMNYGLNR